MERYCIKNLSQNEKWEFDHGRFKVINNPPFRQVLIDYVLIAEYIAGDHFYEALAMVTIIKNGVTTVSELADCFGIHRQTIYNYLDSYNADGLEGLRPAKNYTGKVNNEIISFIKKAQQADKGLTLTRLNRMLDKKFHETVSENSVQRLIKAEQILPLAKEQYQQLSLEEVVEQHESTKTPEADGSTYTRYAGYLIYSGMICSLFGNIFQHLDSLSYTSHTLLKKWDVKRLITTWILYFLIGITNVEQSKTICRREFGCIIDEDASPCSKTLKRNMQSLTEMDIPDIVQDALVMEYISQGYVEMGQFYFDGHFVPYYGKKDIGKGFFTQRRLAVPGHEQYWVNDYRGRPIFFLNSYGFSKFPQTIVELVKQAQEYMDKVGITKPLLVAFDRGGYNKNLFTQLSGMGVSWVTWKSGDTKERSEESFTEIFILQTGKEKSEYGILYTRHKMTGLKREFDAAVILNRKTGKQITIIYSIAKNAVNIYSPVDAVKFLLHRWCQENFFKYALEQVDINQTHGLQEGPEEDAYYVSNPLYNDLQKAEQNLVLKLERLHGQKESIKQKYFTLKRKRTWEQYLKQKVNFKVFDAYDEAIKELNQVREKIKETPQTIAYTREDGTTYTYLNFSRIKMLNTLKAAVYNMHCRMVDEAKEIFHDHREISKFLSVLTQTGGYYLKGDGHDTVLLNPLELPAYQAGAERLLLKLNSQAFTTLGSTGKPLVIRFNK